MATLADLAKLVRSKNAGPFWLTIDIMFDDAQAYRRARDAEIVNRAAIARLYNRDPAEVIVVNHDTALAIKVSFPRPQSSGSKARQRRLRRAAIRAAAGARGAGLRPSGARRASRWRAVSPGPGSRAASCRHIPSGTGRAVASSGTSSRTASSYAPGMLVAASTNPS